MTTTDWIIVAGAIVGGIALGTIASRIVAAILGAESRPAPLRAAAGAIASLAMSVFLIIGLVVALGVISPAALEQLPKDVIAFVPKLLSAAIIVIAANVLSSFAVAAIGPSMGRMPAAVQRRTLGIVKAAILGLGILLAIGQVGVDTTVINLAMAAIFFGLAGALMLLVALGGRTVAEEVASTRVLRRMFKEGDRVSLDSLNGTIVSVHPTAIELQMLSGETLLVPSSRFMSGTISIDRAEQDSPNASA